MASSQRILSIDPGERVGWAIGTLTPGDTLTVDAHGISALKPFAVRLGEAFPNYDVVVYEKWILAAGLAAKLAGSDMQSSQLIGIIRYLSWLHPHVKLVGQRPAERDKEMKTLPVGHPIRTIIDGLPKAHDESHDRDALLHLHRYYWKRYA